MTSHAIHVFDDVVANPEAYRAAALSQPFGDLQSGAITFHGMAPIGRSPLAADLELAFGLTTTFEAFRLSQLQQEEPSYIHQDRDMGEWTAILFLNPDPPPEDGTIFWKHRATGAMQSTAETEDEKLAEWLNWRDVSQWESWHVVPSKFNRLLLFPAPYFHSRAVFANWGEGDEARLIQICFGTGTLPCVHEGS